MSVFQDILENLSRELTQLPICRNKNFYYDLSQVNANTELPCLVFQEFDSDPDYYKQENSMGCVTLTLPIQIILCIPFKDTSKLIADLWNFREAITIKFSNVMFRDIHPNLVEMKYVGSSALKSIEFTAFDYNDNEVFMCSSIAVKFLLTYDL